MLSWWDIVRLGLVQASLGSIVVLTTSTMNRVMVVELALPALVPGMLVALHYFVQVSRPVLGYQSDVGGRRTPWIVGGMATLAAGAIGAALSLELIAVDRTLGLAAATLAFAGVGVGVAASGTAMLVLLAQCTAEQRLAAAATITWVMMIGGFIVTTAVAGRLLEPFSLWRLVEVTAGVGAVAVAVTALAVRGIEARAIAAGVGPRPRAAGHDDGGGLREALRALWAEPHTRRLAVFIFVSMLAYNAQDLVLEPFAGALFGLTPGASTRLSGTHNAGILTGMVAVALICTRLGGQGAGSPLAWTIAGCLGSALALALLAVAAGRGPPWPLHPHVYLLGVANGAYSVAAIATMMRLVRAGRGASEGTRMGMWGGAQVVAFGISGLAATAVVDLVRAATGAAAPAYAVVFAAQAALFVVSSLLAAGLHRPRQAR